MNNILIVEDEDSIRGFIKINLKRHGFHILEAPSGEEALSILHQQKVDVILLDVMLPGIDGFEVCRKIREQNETIGIIMLTARTQEVERVHGLALGADDYMNKPFSPTELIARIQSLLRRISVHGKVPIATKQTEFPLNPKTKQITMNGKITDLTPTEFALIQLLMRNKNQPLSRNDLLDEVWGLDYPGDTKIVDVNIRRIRQKIEENPSNPKWIITVWGYGYQWAENSN
ncbi:response regulator transcription factor [Priestia taiwanensis]|uniref:DNA-binding response regulator n=1 Tax=Priestia taiwanensis TaxID=1347902 RepID=A0A917ES37_9BACI|nr:response regulator transcription factor [Priestia taiwanensis]MBM7364313.1 DNA-binding response OmpR family regulator [Priestia taiwanensis]GGE73448.1 DNA-binding response regulator [Priestia taiwanensis]